MGSLSVDCSEKRGSLGVRFAKKRGSFDRKLISADIWECPTGPEPELFSNILCIWGAVVHNISRKKGNGTKYSSNSITIQQLHVIKCCHNLFFTGQLTWLMYPLPVFVQPLKWRGHSSLTRGYFLWPWMLYREHPKQVFECMRLKLYPEFFRILYHLNP